MKNVLKFLTFILLTTVLGWPQSQINSFQILRMGKQSTAPANPPINASYVYFDGTNMVCVTSAGASCLASSGGSGTVTSIATTSPIGGGTITGTGTLTCATCLTATSPTNHGVLIGAGTQAVGATTAGTSGQVLTSNGATADPTFQPAAGGTVNSPTITPVAASPAIPYSGLLLWFSADCITFDSSLACTVPANGTSITRWNDRSGNFANATLEAGTCTFNTNQLNTNKSAVTFSTCRFDSSVPGNLRETTIFAVAKGNSAKGQIIANDSNGFNWYFGGTKEQGADNSTISTIASGTAATDTNYHQLNVTCVKGANPTFRLDRAADATIASNTCGFGNYSTRMSLGGNPGSGSENLTGSVAEVLVYRRLLSSTEITTVETYLNSKYGL